MEIKQSGILKLLRRLLNKDYITLFGEHVDFRDWYVTWVKKGEDPFDREFEGWCDSWDTPYEMKELLEEYPNIKYKKINAFFTIIKWKSLYYRHEFKCGAIVGLALGYLIFEK